MTPPPDFNSAAEVTGILRNAADALRSSPHRAGSVFRLPNSGRVLVTGDLHDNPDNLSKIVKLACLKSPGNHLILHEIIHSEHLVNRVDLSHRMLLRVAALIVSYPTQVCLLLANHELAQMTGKGVSKGAGDSVALFNDGLAFVYGDGWIQVAEAIKALIRALPLAARSDAGLLCAHSLPGPRPGFDPAVLDRDLTDADYRRGTDVGEAGSAYLMVWGRGYSAEQVETLATRWGVRLFCLGHEHVANGIEARGPRVIVLNSDHEFATALPIDLAGVPTAEEAVMSAIRLRSVPSESIEP